MIDIITQDYIDAYLNSKQEWELHMTPEEKYEALTSEDIDNESIRDFIVRMDYKEFLKTPYWKGIAQYLKSQSGGCQMCGRDIDLVIHHRSYKMHGLEHTPEGQKELIVLCNSCHAKAPNCPRN